MYEILASVVSYIYQISVILFVLKEFGFIKIQANGASQDSTQEQSEPSQANPLGDIMKNMGPMVEQMMSNMGKPQKKQQQKVLEADDEVDTDKDLSVSQSGLNTDN